MSSRISAGFLARAIRSSNGARLRARRIHRVGSSGGAPSASLIRSHRGLASAAGALPGPGESGSTLPPAPAAPSVTDELDESIRTIDAGEVADATDLAASAETASEVVAGPVAAVGDSFSLSDALLTPATSFITNLHEASGLPWWGTIVLATLSVRTMILPVSIYTMRNASKMAAIQDDLKSMREEIMTAMKSGNRPLAEKKQAAQREFMAAAGVSPGRVLIGPLLQFPVFISFFVGIRRMAAENPEFVSGGLAWFADLSSKDTTFGLPVLAGATLFAMTELGGDTGTKMTPTMRMAMRFVAVASVPLTSWMPAAVFCYWIPNNIFSVCLGGAMRSPILKKRLGLAVDPVSIVGTKAAARAAREKGLASLGNVSPSEAASSYMRINVKTPDTAAIAAVSKPVLLSTRPKVPKKSRAA
jgi:YidC/Oxa1 family membrane protein insertase